MSLDILLRTKPCPTCGHTEEVFDWTITHNLGKMAAEAGLYKAIWRPDENGITEAKQIIPTLSAGMDDLILNPERYKKFNPENGWGNYEGLVKFVAEYLKACEENPEAEIKVLR